MYPFNIYPVLLNNTAIKDQILNQLSENEDKFSVQEHKEYLIKIMK